MSKKTRKLRKQITDARGEAQDLINALNRRVAQLDRDLYEAREQIKRLKAQMDGHVTPIIGEYLMQERGTAEYKIEQKPVTFGPLGTPAYAMEAPKTTYVVQLHGKTYVNGKLTEQVKSPGNMTGFIKGVW